MSRILLIEDDEIMRENTAEILELAQYDVSTAKDGKEGVSLASEVKPDLIICDIMMPGLDGHGVLHILNKDPQTATIPFIFLTARAEKSDFRKGMELGADDYLTKPFDDAELLNAVEVRLKKRKQIQESFPQEVSDMSHYLEREDKAVSLRVLFQNLHARSFKKKVSLFNEGDKPESIYFLKSGKVKTVKVHEEGKDFITDVFGADDFIGAADFFLGKRYSYSAITLEQAEVITLSKDEVLPLILKNVDVSRKFIKILSKSVKESEDKLMSLAYDSVRKRVANSIVSLAHNSNSLRISRDDLANYIGTATETLIRCLGELKEQGLIRTHGRTIEILDLELLDQIK